MMQDSHQGVKQQRIGPQPNSAGLPPSTVSSNGLPPTSDGLLKEVTTLVACANQLVLPLCSQTS